MMINRATFARATAASAAKQLRWGHKDTFLASELKKEVQAGEVQLPPLDTLEFGKVFARHMLSVDWTRSDGWEAPQIKKYEDLRLSPAASSLHYALQCFEGMKAYRTEDDSVLLFRPDMNSKRLNRSVQRLELPTFDNAEFMKCLTELLKVDKDWIPKEKGYSLYIRPTVISTDVCLGVAPAAAAQLFIITCPVGPYYRSGFKPVKLLADNVNVRAWQGGTGSYKIGANYGPTIHPALEAAKKGFSQVLWLGPDDTVTEVGAMNLFFVFKDGATGGRELVTSPLDGTVLPGVTRDSILQLASDVPGMKVSERVYTMTEVVERLSKGEVLESFGAGTAAIVSPVNQIHFKGTDYDIPVPEDSFAVEMMNRIMSIQYGEVDHPWSVRVC